MEGRLDRPFSFPDRNCCPKENFCFTEIFGADPAHSPAPAQPLPALREGVIFALENALHLKRIGLWLMAYPASQNPIFPCRNPQSARRTLLDARSHLPLSRLPARRPSGIPARRSRPADPKNSVTYPTARRGLSKAPSCALFSYECRLCGRESCDRNAVGRAGDIVQSRLLEEADGLGVAAMLAADAELQAGSRLPPA